MPPTESKLESALLDADREFSADIQLVDGASIRRRADRRTSNNRSRRRALFAASVLVLLALGWRFMMPVNSRPDIAAVPDGPSVVELQSELDELRKDNEQLAYLLEIHRMKDRLLLLDQQMTKVATSQNTIANVFEQNRDSWSMLLHFANKLNPSQPLSDSEILSFQMVATNFPNTEAAKVVSQIVSTNQVPSFLYE